MPALKRERWDGGRVETLNKSLVDGFGVSESAVFWA
jgi:hypothetical protein